MENTIDILNIFKQKFINKEFRFIGNNVQESSTLEKVKELFGENNIEIV